MVVDVIDLGIIPDKEAIRAAFDEAIAQADLLIHQVALV